MMKEKPLQLASHPRGIALYVHIPFCKSKCRYCDFFSVVSPSPETLRRLVAAEVKSLAWFRRELDLESIDTVYVGGGTPSVLTHDLFRTLLEAIQCSSCLPPWEWTVEANPESLDEAFLCLCEEAGVTRLSVGIQSFNDRLLRFLGRPGTSEDNRRALELIHDHWPGDWSLDLMTGIPGQDEKAALADLEQALEAEPGHISVYTLTLEPGTALCDAVDRGEVSPVSPEQEAAVWEMICQRMIKAGCRQYEVSNFAYPGRESRHNLHYWRLDPYIGIGPGAVSTLAADNGNAVRLEITRQLTEFFTQAPPQYLHQEWLTARQLLLDHLLMGLRLGQGINRETFQRRFGRPLPVLLPRTWQSWRERGLAGETAYAWRCTKNGRLVLNTLLKQAAEEIEACPGLDEMRVNWP